MKLFCFIKAKNGSISIFMAIILFAMFTLSSILVEGSRIRNAKTIIQSASDSAAKSLLANYDKELKNRYGLFVLDETDIESLKSDYLDFFMTNLSSNLPENDSINQLFKDMSISLGFEKEITDTFDLYGFENGEVNVDKVYSIIEPMVMRKQVAEFSKYRAAFSVSQFINIGNDISSEAEKNKIDMENIQNTLDSRENVENIVSDYKKFSEDVKEFANKYNSDCIDFINSISGIDDKLNNYKTEMEKLKDVYDSEYDDAEIRIQECEDNIQTLISHLGSDNLNTYYKKIDNFSIILSSYGDEVQSLIDRNEKLIVRINNAINEQKNIKNNIKSGGNKETEDGIKKDADSAIEELENLKGKFSNTDFLTNAKNKIYGYTLDIADYNENLDILLDMGSLTKTQSGYEFPRTSDETDNAIKKAKSL